MCSDCPDGTRARAYISLPYSTVVYRARTHTPTVLFRTLLCFTVLVRIRQQIHRCDVRHDEGVQGARLVHVADEPASGQRGVAEDGQTAGMLLQKIMYHL